MRKRTISSSVSVLLALLSWAVDAKHADTHLALFERRHQHQGNLHRSVAENAADALRVRSDLPAIKKRGGTCQFPTDAGLVAVTPDQQNAGWAMSPDQPCKPDQYCPYACPPGQLAMQWSPDATSYTYPESMAGGLYCNDQGQISKPFPNKPYCVDGTGVVGVQNNAQGVVSFCQTVLPGNEAMLIPTSIEDWEQLAVPDPSYWCSTAAHFYINPPGVGSADACIWGTSGKPVGNWAPYVAGANTDQKGDTYVKLGWNPVYLEKATPFRDDMPTWGVEIICESGGCNGLPCAIDPSKNGVNEMVGSVSDGAGDGAFCVVTVPKGGKANFVVFEGSSGSSGAKSQSPQSSSAPPSSSTAALTSSLSSSSSWQSTSTYITSSWHPSSTTSRPQGNSSHGHDLDQPSADAPHIFVENSTETSSRALTSSPAQTSVPPQETKKSAASVAQLSFLSVIMATLVISIRLGF